MQCTKVIDTEFLCGDCPRGMEGDGIECTAVDEVGVSACVLSISNSPVADVLVIEIV